MLIEIHGGQFENKGAYKMLMTTIDKIKGQYPDVDFIVDCCVGSSSQRKALTLKEFLFTRGWMGGRRFSVGLIVQQALSFFLSTIPVKYRRFYLLSDVNMLIDISGFAYSDQWGVKPARDFSKLSLWYSKRGVPVVMLPQAFGPFSKPRMSEYVSKIISSSSVVFARDSESAKYLRSVNPDSKIKQCPDMTLFESSLFVSGSVEGRGEARDNGVVGVVPNMRMLDRTSGEGQQYITCLNFVVDNIIQLGLKPVFVIHDLSGDDKKVVDMMQRDRRDCIDVLEVEDPWELKMELAKMRLVVGSRYHALVAAISWGVPVLAIGWSHKYAELLADFGLDKYVLDPEKEEDHINELIRESCDPAENNLVRGKIKNKYRDMIELNENMWEEVLGIVSCRRGG